MIQWVLAVWSLLPLPFLNLSWTSWGSQFMYHWILAWRILRITLRETWVRSMGWEDSPGEGNGYPPQCSGLENSMDYTVHGVTKSGTWLSNFQFHFASMWDECNCVVVWTFFCIAFLWDWNESWPFPYQTLFISDWSNSYNGRKFTASATSYFNSLCNLPFPLEGLEEAYFTCSSLFGQYQSFKTQW